MEKLDPKCQNCQLKLKFGSKTDPNMQNSMVILTFSFETENIHFGQICFKKPKLSV